MLHVFDVDGVLADFTLAFTSLAHQRFGAQVYSAGQQLSWSYSPHLVTTEQEDQLWDHIKKSTDFWESVPTLVSVGDLADMHRLEGKILYLTSRVGHHPGHQTERWLAQHGFPKGEVVISHDKLDHLLPYGTAARIIEDRPDVVEKLYTGGIFVACRDWQYNRHVSCTTRVSSVSEYCGLPT